MTETRTNDALAVGMQLPIQAQSRLFAAPWEETAGAAELVRVAQACDRAGFDYVAVCEHVAIPQPLADSMSTAWWDQVATLSYLAAVTERVRLLSHVAILSYRHPLMTAKSFATLDALSGGRVIVGAGAGHVDAEFEVLGVPFDERGRILDEAIDAVRACFDDEFPRHDGQRWQFAGMGQQPRPVQARVPIWVGGSSPAAMRRAAERGDGWLPQGPPKMGMTAGVAFVREHRARTRGDDPFTVGSLSGPLYLGEPTWDVGRALTGPADRITEALLGHADIGVDQVQVAFKSRSVDEMCDQISRFGEDIVPHLGRSS
jgi:probable F420-dependent oxidoreductase